MSKTFTAGDRVYDIHGNAAEYVASVNGGHVVQPLYEDDDNEPVFSSPMTWRQVFKEPPTAVLHEECAKLEAQAATARSELDRLRTERREFDAEERARLERLKRHSQLALLDDFLAGRITHFVVRGEYSDAVTIKPAAAALKGNDEWRREWIRLLTLYGDSKGDLNWRLNRYADGSGSGGEFVWPALSEEHAKTIAAGVIEDLYAAALAKPERPYGLPDTVKSAQALDLPIPEAITALLADYARRSAEQAIPELEKRAREAAIALNTARITAGVETAGANA